MGKVGVIYWKVSKIPIMVVSTDDHTTLPTHVGENQDLFVIDTGDKEVTSDDIPSLHDYFYQAMGITEIQNSRCAVVDRDTNFVINIIEADPIMFHTPEGAVVSISGKVAIGDKFDFENEKFLLKYAIVDANGIVSSFDWIAEDTPQPTNAERNFLLNIGDVCAWRVPSQQVNVETSGTQPI